VVAAFKMLLLDVTATEEQAGKIIELQEGDVFFGCPMVTFEDTGGY